MKITFIVFALIAGFFLILEHRAHVYPYLPWLLLAACPLMHVFMHGRHGNHGDHRGHVAGSQRTEEDSLGCRETTDTATAQSSTALETRPARHPRRGTS